MSASDPYDLASELPGGIEGADGAQSRARAMLRIGPEGIDARLDDGRRVLVRWSGMSIRRGGASGEVIFCRAPGSPTVFSEAPGFVRAIEAAGGNDVADELARLAGERVATRRRHALAMLLVLCAVVGLVWSTPKAFRGTIDLAVSSMPVSFDRKIGESVWETVDAGGPLVEDEELTGALRAMVERLAPDGEVHGEPIELRLIESEEANAFALPGGFLTVSTGLLREAEVPEQVAAVLAHELAHVELRHGIARIAHSIGTWTAVRLFLGDSDGFTAIAREIFQLATVNDYSRDQEREADRRGVELLARARIDPRAAARFFELLRERYGDVPSALAWMSTHPLNEERMAAVERAIDELDLPAETEPLAIDWERVRARLAR